MTRLFNRWLKLSRSAKRNCRKRGTTRRRLKPEMLEARQLLAANIFHNELMPEDVNEDGVVSAIDALTVINRMSLQSQGGFSGDGGTQPRGPGQMTDVNNDGRDTALDALMVINRMNRDKGGTAPTTRQDSVDDPLATPQAETDVVLDWNNLFGDLLASSVANQNPGYASRSMAMLNVAIYDALAIAEGGANPDSFYDYGIDFSGTAGNVTTEVVASQAAYTVLSSLYSDQQATIDAFLDSSLAGDQDSADIAASLALGTEIGNEILAIRAGDGWDAVVDYTYTDEAGSFQPDPLNPDVPVWGPGWGDVDTFAISSAQDYTPETTPALTSEEYAASYNEVKQLGSVDSTERTAEQTETGIFWAYDRLGLGTPLALYSDVLETIAVQQGNTLAQNAALFAQASVAMADAAIVAWTTKFSEEFWRPVTAIRDGDIDGNPLTEGDAEWTALGAPDGGDDEIGFTPQFPTYISGHATFGGALFGTLQEFYGTDDIAFELTSQELEILLDDPELQAAYGLNLDDATRSFDSLSEAMAENGRSRVYLGIHFDFDDLVGQQVGQSVATTIASLFAEITGDGDDSGDDGVNKGTPGEESELGGNKNGGPKGEGRLGSDNGDARKMVAPLSRLSFPHSM